MTQEETLINLIVDREQQSLLVAQDLAIEMNCGLPGNGDWIYNFSIEIIPIGKRWQKAAYTSHLDNFGYISRIMNGGTQTGENENHASYSGIHQVRHAFTFNWEWY